MPGLGLKARAMPVLGGGTERPSRAAVVCAWWWRSAGDQARAAPGRWRVSSWTGMLCRLSDREREREGEGARERGRERESEGWAGVRDEGGKKGGKVGDNEGENV